MSLFRFELVCPRCNKSAQHVSQHDGKHFKPHISCGDCLMNDVEIVEFAVERVTRIECKHDFQQDPVCDLVDVCSICGEERA